MITCSECGSKVHVTGPCRTCEQRRRDAERKHIHTPGPWSQEHKRKGGEITIYGRDGQWVGNIAISANKDRMASDASLVSAAPTLLEACKKIEAQITYLCPTASTLSFVRAAIKMAEES